MHFKCVVNALQRIDNGSQRICNVIQSIVKTLTMFNKCLRMDEKRVANALATFDTNSAQNVENKAKHIVNTTNSGLFISNKFN